VTATVRRRGVEESHDVLRVEGRILTTRGPDGRVYEWHPAGVCRSDARMVLVDAGAAYRAAKRAGGDVTDRDTSAGPVGTVGR
jgi:hypothetical protein